MSRRYIRIVNWDRYQHYKNRRPPWIKLYTELLHPFNKLNDLPVPTRYLFDRLLLLAAEYENAVPNDAELIGKVLRMEREDVTNGIESLAKGRWIQVSTRKHRASNRLATCVQNPSPETETENIKNQPPQTPPNVFPIPDLKNVENRVGGI